MWFVTVVFVGFLAIAVYFAITSPRQARLGEKEKVKLEAVKDSLYKVVMGKEWKVYVDEFSKDNTTFLYANYPKSDSRPTMYGRMVMSDSVCDYFRANVRVPERMRVMGAIYFEVIYGKWKEQFFLDDNMQNSELDYTDYGLMEYETLQLMENYQEGVDLRCRIRDLSTYSEFTIPAEDLAKVKEMSDVFQAYMDKMGVELRNELEALQPSGE